MMNCDFAPQEQVNRQYGSNRIVTIVAFLLGIKTEVLETQYDSEVLGSIKEILEANIVRRLAKIRQALLSNFKAANYELCINLSNIDKLDFCDADDIQFLKQNAVPVMNCNCNADEYVVHITKLIFQHIDACKVLFPACINFAYIRSLFYFPIGFDETDRRKEYGKYWNNRSNYPFGAYLYWKPQNCGNLLLNDNKFLVEVYRQHKEEFKATYLFKDVSYGVKNAINKFIENGSKVVFAVDCENVDPYKFYSMIEELPVKTRKNIREIILYNDINANKAWNCLDKCVTVPVKCVQTQRVLDRKSIVDMILITEVMKMHYEQGIDTVVLCSSDSDFLPLINALSSVRFMVLYEHSKCSSVTKQQWKAEGLLAYSLDDFYLAQSEKLQECVLLETLTRLVPAYIGKNISDLANQVFTQAMVTTTETQETAFCEKYVKHGRFSVDSHGILSFSL